MAHDGWIVEARPWRRTFGTAAIGTIATFLAATVVLWPAVGVLLFGITAIWVLWDWWRDLERGKQQITVTLGTTRLDVVRTRSGTVLVEERVPLVQIGRVELEGAALNHPVLVVRVAGRAAVVVPLQNESEGGVRWLAATIEQAARDARERQDGRGEVPGALAQLVAAGRAREEESWRG